MDERKQTGEPERLPLLPLRALLAYPHLLLKIDVGRDKSIAALQRAMQQDQRLLVVAQRDATVDDPHIEDVYSVGTVVRIKQIVHMPDDTLRVLVQGESRALILDVLEQGEIQVGELKLLEAAHEEDALQTQAYMRQVKKLLRQLAREHGALPAELIEAAMGDANPDTLCDLIAANVLEDVRDKQQILECRSVLERLAALNEILQREIELQRLEKKLQQKVHEGLEQHQKEYYLHEQLQVIHEELGDDDEQEREELSRRLAQSAIHGEARERTERELKRFERMAPGTPEASVSRNYIDFMLELPWGAPSAPAIRIDRARRVLQADHYGLEKVKQRILEYLAVLSIKGDMKAPILCLVGPPGVGKTSIARSIARAVERKFVRMSLGGLRDEAEIRGHRRTYIGAIPGRILSSIRQCGVCDPVFLLDEIDKLAGDFRGDPASALLEALDPEQNSSFVDHYMEAPFDLSRVMFITTANSLDGIPAPLLDRMELIEVEGYTLEEKLQIAKRHLWKKQLAENGLTRDQLKITDAALRRVIDGYTREAGVRTLERELGAICRKAAVKWLETPEAQRAPVSVRPADVEGYLDAPRYSRMDVLKQPEVGVVNALAWTPVGGETMPVEVTVMSGSGAVDLTGRLGDVMKESARIAYSYIRSQADEYRIPDGFYKEKDLHIHVPEGAVPKDGPSAGVALTCAMMSALTGRPARQDVAMTGEITLHGRVLPIGGVKEKLLAAHRMGIETVLLPEENERDLRELPDDVRDKLNVKMIGRVDQALHYVLQS